MSQKNAFLLAVLLLTGCSMKSMREEEPTKAPASAATPAPQAVAASEASESSASETFNRATSEINLPKSQEDDVKITLKKQGAKEAPTPKKIVVGVPAEKALGWLIHGNDRFLKGFFRKDGASKKDVIRVASGQHPHAIILASSDSRVPPEVIFDQKLGEIYVVRTLGPSIDGASLAALEYAAKNLGPHLLVVLGHSQSGLIKMALGNEDAGTPYMNAIVAAMRLRFVDLANKPISKNQMAEAWANANGISRELTERSETLRSLVADGSLTIATGVYEMSKGKVSFKSP